MAESPQPPDLITMGRTGVEIYPRHTGVVLARVDDSGKFRENAAPIAADRARIPGVREPHTPAGELLEADRGGAPDGENR